MLIRTLTPTLSRFAVEGARQSVLCRRVRLSKDSAETTVSSAPLTTKRERAGASDGNKLAL